MVLKIPALAENVATKIAMDDDAATLHEGFPRRSISRKAILNGNTAAAYVA